LISKNLKTVDTTFPNSLIITKCAMILKARMKLTILDKIVLTLNCIVALALLMSYLAPVTDPRKFWIVAILGLAYPLLLLVNAVLIVFWFFRLRLFMLISAICILIGCNILTANFGFHYPTFTDKKPFGGAIRIMAYNVHGFGGFDKTSAKSTEGEIMSLISEEQPDIINIEEFYEDVSTRATIYSSLKKIIKPGYHYFKPYDFTQWDSTGIAIFSKFPITNHGSISSSKDTDQNQAIFADVKKGNTIFRVYCLHLQPTEFNDQEHQYIKSLQHGKLNFHESKVVGNKLRLAFIKRSYEVSLIKQHMARCPYPYIIAGDFNDTPISYAVNQMSEGLKNAFIEKGTGPGITYYGDFPNYQIDYILFNAKFKIIDYEIIKKKISDHYPVMSDLSLQPVK